MSDLVAWSGGMDSTLCLFDMAVRYPQKMITAITVTGIGFSETQRRAEAKARKRIKQEFKKRKINNIVYYDININNNLRKESHQMKLWLSYIIPCLENKDILHMSYLSSDGVDFLKTKTT